MLLADGNKHFKTLEVFHFRSIAHVMNPAVKESMGLFHQKIGALRSLLGSIRCSVKRRDIFDAVKIELRFSNLSLPGIDVETRCSSTFNMRGKA